MPNPPIDTDENIKIVLGSENRRGLHKGTWQWNFNISDIFKTPTKYFQPALWVKKSWTFPYAYLYYLRIEWALLKILLTKWFWERIFMYREITFESHYWFFHSISNNAIRENCNYDLFSKVASGVIFVNKLSLIIL